MNACQMNLAELFIIRHCPFYGFILQRNIYKKVYNDPPYYIIFSPWMQSPAWNRSYVCIYVYKCGVFWEASHNKTSES